MSVSAPHIYFTVTNDLTYDQRMQRICGSLSKAGYQVTLIGRQLPESLPLPVKSYHQVRLKVKYQQGKLFYITYNIELYRFLLRSLADNNASRAAICAIDLDTIVPCCLVARKKKLPRVYDAHELFTELTEVKRRSLIHFIWKQVEKWAVPRFSNGYTVNQFIADEFLRRYNVGYTVIRNLPARKSYHLPEGALELPSLPPRFLLYQGAVNEGRAFDTLIPAMKNVEMPLVIAGDGNYTDQVKSLIEQHSLQKKIVLLGYVTPELLRQITPKAYAGITLFDNSGLNQYYSLANRFFDYIQAGIPQLCIDYPEYAAIQSSFQVALLVKDVLPDTIAEGLNKLISDTVMYRSLKQQSEIAAAELCWENEEIKLLDFWNRILPQ